MGKGGTAVEEEAERAGIDPALPDPAVPTRQGVDSFLRATEVNVSLKSIICSQDRLQPIQWEPKGFLTKTST